MRPFLIAALLSAVLALSGCGYLYCHIVWGGDGGEMCR
jgi:hypothetical protein